MSKFAWVTLTTNDTYSLGALVLAHSLKRVGTAHQLAVLVTPGVSESMRNKLRDVYNLVQDVNVMDSNDAANLALLARPELGVTFTKLHCWRLVQYEKCVFLDADTLVLQNCDELFEREELSAAPDVSWPDCFNSGVFVFRPSLDTFAKITDFAVKNGSFDGGDQGLLNQYFADWAHTDIAKHLPFIYNVTAYASYCYLPAFKQFKDNIKILHFAGKMKPWLITFNSENKTACTPSDYSHAADLIQLWWNIFCDNVHPSLSENMGAADDSNSENYWPIKLYWPTQSQTHYHNQQQQYDNQYSNQNQSQYQHHTEYQVSSHVDNDNVPEYTDPWIDYYEKQQQQQQQEQEQQEQQTTEQHEQEQQQQNTNNPQQFEHERHETTMTDNRTQSETITEHFHEHTIEVAPTTSSSPSANAGVTSEEKPLECNRISSDEPASTTNTQYSANERETDKHSCENSSMVDNNVPTTTTTTTGITATASLAAETSNRENVEVPSSSSSSSSAAATTAAEQTQTQMQTQSPKQNHTQTQRETTTNEAGLAGALSQLRLGAQRTPEQEAYEQLMRRQCWESGQIDYSGKDSFENIWLKITQTLENRPASAAATKKQDEPSELLTSADIEDGKTEYDPATKSTTKYKLIEGGYEMITTTPQPNGTTKTQVRTFWDPKPVSEEDLIKEAANKKLIKTRLNKEIRIDKNTTMLTREIEGGYEEVYTTINEDGTKSTRTKTFFDSVPQELGTDTTNKAVDKKKKTLTKKTSVESTDSTESRKVTKIQQQKNANYRQESTVEETRRVTQNIEISENNRTVRKDSVQEQNVKSITQSSSDKDAKKKKKKAIPPPPADFIENDTTTVSSKRVPGGVQYTYSTQLESGKTITTSKTVYEEEDVDMTEEEIRAYKKTLKDAEKHKNVTSTKKLKSESGTKKIVPSENPGDVTTVETIKIEGGTEYHYTTVTAEGIVKKAVKTIYDPVPSQGGESDEEEIIEEYEEEIIEPGEKNIKTIETVQKLPKKFEEEVTITHEKKEKKIKKSMVISH